MNEAVKNYDHKTIQFRRGTTAEWQRYGAVCIPAEAEICVEFLQRSDGTRTGATAIKVGNGVSYYNQLPYLVSNEETDPVFTNHPAYQITQELIDLWTEGGFPDAPTTEAYSRKKGVWVKAPTLKQVTDLEQMPAADISQDDIDRWNQPHGISEVSWADVKDKPEPIKDLGASDSLIKGGTF